MVRLPLSFVLDALWDGVTVMPTDLRLYRTLATFRTICRTYIQSQLSLLTLNHNSRRLPNSFRPSRTMIDMRSLASTGSGTYGYRSEHPTRIRASFPLTSTILIPTLRTIMCTYSFHTHVRYQPYL